MLWFIVIEDLTSRLLKIYYMFVDSRAFFEGSGNIHHHFFISMNCGCNFLLNAASFHGFAFWFDVEFAGTTMSPINGHPPTSLAETHSVDGSQRKKRSNPSEALVLSTAPEDPPTHWQQVQ